DVQYRAAEHRVALERYRGLPEEIVLGDRAVQVGRCRVVVDAVLSERHAVDDKRPGVEVRAPAGRPIQGAVWVEIERAGIAYRLRDVERHAEGVRDALHGRRVRRAPG